MQRRNIGVARGVLNQTLSLSLFLASPQDVDVSGAYSLLIQQFVTRLPGIRLKVTKRAYVSGYDFQCLTTLHVTQRLFCSQNGQGTTEAAGVDFFVNLHGCFPIEHAEQGGL